MAAIKVMIVDDSAVVRQVLGQVLNADAGIEVIATAPDPLFALRKMEQQWPDVIVLDIEMPRMDGITFLKKLMQEHPTPVVICSSLTERGAEVSMQAMAAGAVEIITKPRFGARGFFMEEKETLTQAVRSAARVRSDRLASSPPARRAKPLARIAPASTDLGRTTDKVIAIGTSTGGTQALERVLVALPRTVPGIVVVQHMPEKFTAAFAQRLNSVCEVAVSEARDGDRIGVGMVLIAPGGKHMQLLRNGAQYSVSVRDGPLVNRHRPSVDVLFRSTATVAGRNALGVIMTGMGDDGAEGMLAMHQAGIQTVAQDEASCVVFGMPKEAIKRGAVDKICALDQIPEEIMRYARDAMDGVTARRIG